MPKGMNIRNGMLQIYFENLFLLFFTTDQITEDTLFLPLITTLQWLVPRHGFIALDHKQ